MALLSGHGASRTVAGQQRHGVPRLEDLNAALIGAFLAHLESERGSSVRTRKARLTAIHSFFHYVSWEATEHAELIQRAHAVPQKRFDTTLISYLERPEIEALLHSPDRSTRIGRRDDALLLLAVQTGLRVSELAGLRARICNSAPPRTCAVTGSWMASCRSLPSRTSTAA